MREILFRGKRTDNGKWVYGFPFAYQARLVVEGIETWDGDRHSIDPSTIGQYTGLIDKNGKRIFEGDIIDMTEEWWDASGPAHHDSPICAVEFDEFTGGFNPFANYDCDCGVYINASGCKVIGSIHDIPELLGEVTDNG